MCTDDNWVLRVLVHLYGFQIDDREVVRFGYTVSDTSYGAGSDSGIGHRGACSGDRISSVAR